MTKPTSKKPSKSSSKNKAAATNKEQPATEPLAKASARPNLAPQVRVKSSMRKASQNRRVDALFKAMSSDFLLQEQFVTEPTQLLAEFVHNKKLKSAKSSVADQFVYSVMSSDGLLSWFHQYAQQQGGRLPEQAQLINDFSKAVVTTDAYQVVTALARGAAEKGNSLSTQFDFLAVIFESISAGLGSVMTTEMSTGHTTGTEMSTGHIAATEMSTGHTTGTEMSTGHLFTTEMSTGHTTGTEMSTGHIAATEMSTGHTTGTEMSTGHIAATEMSTGHTTGTEMSTGHVFTTEMSTGHTTGTEMSTGHLFTTEMSTGHTTGTEMSTGHSVGDITNIFMPHHRATFASLIQHSKQLKASGLLDFIK